MKIKLSVVVSVLMIPVLLTVARAAENGSVVGTVTDRKSVV